MDNVKNDAYFMRKAIEDIETIEKYTKGISYEDFIKDGKTLDAVMFRLVQMIENIKNISDEFKEKTMPITDWGKAMGFRNGIVHEYGETDYTIVYEVITRDIQVIKELFKENI